MLSLGLMTMKRKISNLQLLIDGGRVLQHKKYQMMNQIHFNQPAKPQVSLPHRLQKNEIQTRILKLLHESELIDIRQFSFSDDIRKQYYLESLDITALVSSIEEQFNTIFDADTFYNAKSLEIIVEALMNDPTIV